MSIARRAIAVLFSLTFWMSRATQQPASSPLVPSEPELTVGIVDSEGKHLRFSIAPYVPDAVLSSEISKWCRESDFKPVHPCVRSLRSHFEARTGRSLPDEAVPDASSHSKAPSSAFSMPRPTGAERRVSSRPFRGRPRIRRAPSAFAVGMLRDKRTPHSAEQGQERPTRAVQLRCLQ